MNLPRWLSPRPVAPALWDQIDAEWMTRAIARDHPDARVGSVRLVERDDGTNRRARFELDYAAGDGPRRLFLKAHAPSHRWVHFRNGNVWNEARLFARGAELPLEHPHVYLSVPDYPRLDFLLVMEDVCARGADPHDSRRAYSVDQVASGLRGLAKLHALYWGITDATHPKLKWVKPWEPSPGWQVGLRRCVPKGMGRGEDLLGPQVRPMTGNAIVDLWARYVGDLGRGAPTLLHGDAHIGNTYLLPDGTVGFLDWQVVRRGNWSQDVGYFLVGSLTPEDRRAHEKELLELYRDALELPAADRPSFEEVWQRYRASHIHGLTIWLSTLGTEGYQLPEISRALVRRYAAAFEETDTISALEEISR